MLLGSLVSLVDLLTMLSILTLWHFVRLSIFRVAFCLGGFGPWHFVLWHFVPWHYVRDSQLLPVNHEVVDKWLRDSTTATIVCIFYLIFQSSFDVAYMYMLLIQ